MKKFYTLAFAGLAAASAMAAPKVMPVAANCDDLASKMKPEARQMINTRVAQMKNAFAAGQELAGTTTRSWVSGTDIWTIQLQNMSTDFITIFDDVQWTDPNGNPVEPVFENLPLHSVVFIISKTNAQGQVVTQSSSVMGWPSYYLWDESLPADTKLDEETRKIVTVEDLANSADVSKTFEFSGYITPVYDTNNVVTTWPLFWLEPAVVDGTDNLEPSRGSAVRFNSWEEDVLSVGTQFRFSPSGNIRINYEGTYIENGFSRKDYTWEAGEINIFYGGQYGSEIAGDHDMYQLDEAWGPFSRYYIAGCTPELTFNVDASTSKKFDINSVRLSNRGTTVPDDKFTYFRGTMYGTALEGNPTTADAPKADFKMAPVWQEEYAGMQFTMTKPLENCLIMGGFDEEWSAISNASFSDGLAFGWQGYFRYLADGTVVGCSTKDGLVMIGVDDFQNTYTVKFKGDINYYGDANDMTKKVTIAAVGDREVPEVEFGGGNSAVEEIFGNESAVVSAANGVITVVAAENAPLAIYSLNGQIVKAADVVAGQTVNVKADKGLYIVKVGKAAKKVVL